MNQLNKLTSKIKNSFTTKRPIAGLLLALGAMFSLLSGCELDESQGTLVNSKDLPASTDYNVSFYCQDVGIHEDVCILEDPANPYRLVDVNDTTKWDLHTAAPGPKAKFYLWATAMAKSPTGENQYYTAQALHELWSKNKTDLLQIQAKAAYKSLLQNYFDSVTYFEASWIDDTPKPTYKVSLNLLVAQNLHAPVAPYLTFYTSGDVYALKELNDWGFVYEDEAIFRR